MANSQNYDETDGSVSDIQDFTVRTMSSDRKSIKNQGGGSPKPYKPEGSAEVSSKGETQGGNTPPPPPPGNSAREPSQESGEAKKPPGDGIDKTSTDDSDSNRGLLVVVGVTILILGLAGAVYFIFLTPDESDTINSSSVPESATTTERTDNGEEGVANQPQLPNTDNTTSNPDESSQAGIPVSEHQNLFTQNADSTTQINTQDFVLNDIEWPGTPSNIPHLKEVVLANQDGMLLPFSSVAPTFAPKTFPEIVLDSFRKDYTLFIYYNSQGSWLGLIGRLNLGADTQTVKSAVRKIEDNIDEVENFYISNPGQAGSWQDGGANGVSSRYLTFDGGSSFNYGWQGDILIMTTSYSAFQEATSRL